LELTVINIVSSSLIWAEDRVVAIDASRYTGPNTLAVIAVLDKLQAARKGIIHCLALILVKDTGPTTFAASHWPIIGVLVQGIRKSVTDEGRLQIDITFLVR
jgi:hypothetical protein